MHMYSAGQFKANLDNLLWKKNKVTVHSLELWGQPELLLTECEKCQWHYHSHGHAFIFLICYYTTNNPSA